MCESPFKGMVPKVEEAKVEVPKPKERFPADERTAILLTCAGADETAYTECSYCNSKRESYMGL